jgi:DNA polymerase III delta subunit
MSLHLFTGEEWLRKRAISQLKRDLRAQSLISWVEASFDGEEFSISRFAEALHTSPLFREKVILHVRRVEKLVDPESLARALERPVPPERCVILEADKLDKRGKLHQTITRQGQIHDHPRLDRRNLPSLTSQLLKERGVKLAPPALRYFLESVEGNPFRIDSEIEKLSIYSRSGAATKELSPMDLRELLFHDRGGDLFACLDALMEKRPDSLRALQQLLESGEEPSKVFYLWASQARALLMVQSLVRAGASSDEIAQRTGDYPWRVAKRRRMAEPLTARELMDLIHRFHEEDWRIKRGEHQPEDALWALAVEWTSLSGS